MREFDSAQVQRLLAGPSFTEDTSERVCPACGAASVRTYVHRRTGAGRPALITYSWCAACRRFKGWTGPDSGELAFTDPLADLSAAGRRELERDFDAFLRRLDGLWDSGELPQRFGEGA